MAARTFAITLGAGLLLSACAGGDDTTTDEMQDTGDTTDTGTTSSEADITGAWNLVTSTYTLGGTDYAYSWPSTETDPDTGNTYNASITVNAAADGTGAAAYAYSTVYADGTPTAEGEQLIGMTWTRSADRSFALVFEAFVPDMSCEIAADDDNAMSCTGTDGDGTGWAWELTR